MPRVIPGGGPDTTSQFLLQLTQGNQALARLYAQLLARYEERREAEAFRREMTDRSEAFRRGAATDADTRWYQREQFRHDLRNPPQTTQPNLLGPGAGNNPLAPQPQTPTAAPAATPTRPPAFTTTTIPGSVAVPGAVDPNKFTTDQGAGVNAPAAPAPQSPPAGAPSPDKFSKLRDVDAYAQANDTDFSAQSRTATTTPAPPPTGTPSVSTPPRPFRRDTPPSTQLPSQPRVSARTQPRPQAQFLEVDQRWLDLMHQQEDKYKLPRGSLMTLYGLENGGGRDFGTKGTATGIYQFVKALRDEHGLTEADTRDPSKMIPAAAFNLRRNADALERTHGVKLPTSSESMPMWAVLHQFGVVDGPRVVAAYLKNPDAPMVSVMANVKDANGQPRNNYNVLVQNGLNPSWTVKQVIQSNKAPFWLNGYIQQYPEHANQPTGSYKPVTITPTTPQEQPPTAAPAAPARPGVSMQGVNPRLVAAIQGGATYLPAGYTIRATSGHRPHGDPRSHHYRGNAGDWQIIRPDGTAIPNRGADTTGMYTYLARGVKTWVTENDPALLARIGYGGAFGTKLSGGGVPDLMHFDLGGSRGRMVPDVQFARLKPLSASEIASARQPQPQQQPTKVAAAPTTAAPTAPRELTFEEKTAQLPTRKDKSWVGSSGFPNYTSEPIATANIFDPTPGAYTPNQFALARTPKPVAAGAGTLAARSDLDFGVPVQDISEGIPTLPTAQLPMPPERPITESGDLAAGTPADVQLPQTDIASNDVMLPTPPMRPPEPEVTQAERTPAGVSQVQPDESVQAAMADVQRRYADPDYRSSDFVAQPPPAVGDLPPQGEISTVAKQPLPSEFDVVTPAQRQLPQPGFRLTPEIDVPTAVARSPLPPEFKIPLPTLGGDATSAAAAVRTNQLPNELQPLPSKLPTLPLAQSVGNAPTIRSIIDAIYSGDIPNLSTATDINAQNAPIRVPRVDPSEAAAVSTIPSDKLQQVGQWLMENFGPQGKPQAQQEFDAWMREKVAQFPDLARTWWYGTKPGVVKTVPIPTPPAAGAPQGQQPQTMPGGGAYLPTPPPLVVPEKKKAGGPTNTTLSAPTQSNVPIPPPPTGTKPKAGVIPINPATGRPDVPQPIIRPDGTKYWPEPGEVVGGEVVQEPE